MSETIAAMFEQLRIGSDHDSHAVEMQILYEHWLKHEDWPVEVCLALLVGVAPDQWAAHLARVDANHERVTHLEAIMGEAIESGEASDTFSRDSAISWLRGAGVVLPAAFARLYEFVQSSMLSMSAPKSDELSDANADTDEKVAILGAALSIVSKEPEHCRDANGFFDGQKIVAMMMKTASRWFPLAAPRLSEQEMIELIDHYLE